MVTKRSSRERMVVAAARCLQRDGYAATSWRRVVVEADAPWGSQAHHFPQGKEQLVGEALDLSGSRFHALLSALLAEHDPATALETWGDLAAQTLADSSYADGCPIATTMLEQAHHSAVLAQRGNDVFNGWSREWAGALRDHGFDEAMAERTATLILAGMEGGLLLARTAREGAPLRSVAHSLAEVVRAAA
ncbi:MAG: TetR/AcrR family transcriptional regulator [Actinomycetota bacterium]